jgi:HEAT repeat protein
MDLSIRLAKIFPSCSAAGQDVGLRVQMLLLPPTASLTPPAAFLSSAAEMIAQASLVSDGQVHDAALELAIALLNRGYRDQLLEASRELTRKCLRDPVANNRIQAIRLALRPETELLEPVVLLLSDPEAEVRRCAMLAVGPAPAIISTDDLLPWLHDSDSEVRQLCEKALRSRGLKEDHLTLGRLITDRRPNARLQVLELLIQRNDLEMGVWLRRLSHDPAPAVRAAAIRAAVENKMPRLVDRIDQLSQNDPSPTVRQLAHFYLSVEWPSADRPER